MAKRSNQGGQSFVEYMLLLSGFSLAALLGLRSLGPVLRRAWTSLAFYFAIPSP